jgi:hypothetical protein
VQINYSLFISGARQGMQGGVAVTLHLSIWKRPPLYWLVFALLAVGTRTACSANKANYCMLTGFINSSSITKLWLAWLWPLDRSIVLDRFFSEYIIMDGQPPLDCKNTIYI